MDQNKKITAFCAAGIVSCVLVLLLYFVSSGTDYSNMRLSMALCGALYVLCYGADLLSIKTSVGCFNPSRRKPLLLLIGVLNVIQIMAYTSIQVLPKDLFFGVVVIRLIIFIIYAIDAVVNPRAAYEKEFPIKLEILVLAAYYLIFNLVARGGLR